jgi:spoIIIJ-associated protein
VDVTVLQEPRQGLLGIGSQPAEVLVRVRRRGEELSEDDLEEQGEIAAEFLEGVLARMGITADVEPVLEGGTMYVDVLGQGPDDDDMGLLIGRHGQTLDALQSLRARGCRPADGDARADHRRRRGYKRAPAGRLEDRAVEIARRVARSGREEELEPMNPFERKVVHDAVATVGGVRSSSRGEDPERRVVIQPA